MRTAFNIYRQLGKYLEVVDAEAAARGEGPEDKSIDPHFRTGVYMGVGSSNLVLSLMPSRLVTIIELFGYRGDRHYGLEMLYKAGGWSKESAEPSVTHGTPNLALLLVFDADWHCVQCGQSKRACDGQYVT